MSAAALAPGARVRVNDPGAPSHGNVGTVLAGPPAGWGEPTVALARSKGHTVFVDFGGEFGFCRGAYAPAELLPLDAP